MPSPAKMPVMDTLRPRIAVCGPHDAGVAVAVLAEQVGVEIARRGGIVICGGLGGVMEAAA
jgi:predicted Rossmann-fold nucleotide-binding protein